MSKKSNELLHNKVSSDLYDEWVFYVSDEVLLSHGELIVYEYLKGKVDDISINHMNNINYGLAKASVCTLASLEVYDTYPEGLSGNTLVVKYALTEKAYNQIENNMGIYLLSAYREG